MTRQVEIGASKDIDWLGQAVEVGLWAKDIPREELESLIRSNPEAVTALDGIYKISAELALARDASEIVPPIN